MLSPCLWQTHFQGWVFCTHFRFSMFMNFSQPWSVEAWCSHSNGTVAYSCWPLHYAFWNFMISIYMSGDTCKRELVEPALRGGAYHPLRFGSPDFLTCTLTGFTVPTIGFCGWRDSYSLSKRMDVFLPLFICLAEVWCLLKLVSPWLVPGSRPG